MIVSQVRTLDLTSGLFIAQNVFFLPILCGFCWHARGGWDYWKAGRALYEAFTGCSESGGLVTGDRAQPL